LSNWSHKLDNYIDTKSISKKQIASELGISINTLQKWWGRREPSPEHATKIQQLLGENPSTTMPIPDKKSVSPMQVPQEFPKQGERDKYRSVVVSLLRKTCLFCGHAVNRSQNCAYCGQHFVWASIPLKT